MEIPLGSKVKDITDGFTGVVTSRTEYLNGCIQYYVQPPVDPKTGEPGKGYSIDVQILKIVGKGCSEQYPLNKVVVKLETAAAKKAAKKGGPRSGRQRSKLDV